MRLVTSCPECSAAFYVLPDQLAAHRGDVRCGKCEHIFNALDRLAEVGNEEIAGREDSVASVENPQLHEPSSEPIPEAFSGPIDIEIIAETNEYPRIEPQTSVEAPPNDRDVKTSGILNPDAATPDFNITDFSIPSAASILSPTMIEDAARNKPGKAGRGGTAKSGLTKFLVVFVVLVLILLTLGQATYYLRSDIAARWPETRPYLEQACAWVQCKVELPKHADLIVIDDSDLQEDAERQGLIHLYSTLINTADYSQTYPLLELTLTDANDKPLLRRTFKPEEYLPADADIKRGVYSNEEISVKLSLTVSDEPVVGYRLFVTY
ncbi:MAG: DUF3426 domain-containing protein [Nitrosomonadales bacterium]|nr:DUF3426 domain-containing protein [Nitrosomonadales bacterium]